MPHFGANILHFFRLGRLASASSSAAGVWCCSISSVDAVVAGESSYASNFAFNPEQIKNNEFETLFL